MNFCLCVRKQNAVGVEDRYTWRHNCVLSVLINHIVAAIERRKDKAIPSTTKEIRFVESGWYRKATKEKAQWYGLLSKTRDWKLCFDLPEYVGKGNRFVMPHNVVMSPLKVDLSLISESFDT